MVDIVQLQMLPEEEQIQVIACCTNGCTCATGDFASNPFCTNGYTGP